MKRLLFVSNGHGEDAIAVTLAHRLAERGFALAAVPLVGRGDAYAAAGLNVLGPRDEQPSGGLLLQDLRLLWGDLRAGWLRSTRARLAALRREARQADACVVVYDAGYNAAVVAAWYPAVAWGLGLHSLQLAVKRVVPPLLAWTGPRLAGDLAYLRGARAAATQRGARRP